jgi:hypothetical protein
MISKIDHHPCSIFLYHRLVVPRTPKEEIVAITSGGMAGSNNNGALI